MTFRGCNSLCANRRSRCRQRRENPPGMKPPHTRLKDRVPINFTGFQLRNSSVSPVRTAHTGTQPKAALSKVQPIAHRPAHTVVGHPANQRAVHPPCSIKSSTSRPTGFSASAVTIAVRMPKQRRSPRATLYSPPPSHTASVRVVCTRPSPGSSLSITSPRLMQSHFDFSIPFRTSFATVAP